MPSLERIRQVISFKLLTDRTLLDFIDLN